MTVYPFAIHLGPLELTGYGLMMMVAFLMAGWAIQLDLRTRGLDEDYAADIIIAGVIGGLVGAKLWYVFLGHPRSEEHTSELQSRLHLVCRLLLEKKKKSRRLCTASNAKSVF